MQRYEVLTTYLRRAYAGRWAIVVDCTNPRETNWLKSHDVLPAWAKQPPDAGAPTYAHWDSAYRTHWFISEPPPDATLPANLEHVMPSDSSKPWLSEWRSRITVHDAFWSLLSTLGERGWRPVGGRVNLPEIILSDDWVEDAYKVPEIYFFERLMPNRVPSPS